MQFILEQNIANAALKHIADIVEPKNTLPILGNALLIAKNNQLTITGTDAERVVTVSIPADISVEGETTVPAHKLKQLIAGYGGTVSLESSEDGNKLTIKSGRSRANLSTLPAADFPSTEEFTPDLKFTMTGDVLHALLHRVFHAMAKQDVRYYLNGALLEIRQDGRINQVATDGHRLCADWAEVPAFETGWPEFDDQANPKPLQVILPNESVRWLLPRLAGADSVTVEIGGGMASFDIGGIVLRTKLIDGRFPDYQAVIPRENYKGHADVVPAEFSAALKRAIVLLNERQKSVALDFADDGILRITAKNDENEEAVEELTYIPQDGFGGMEIGFNPAYLMEAVNSIGSAAYMQFHLIDQNSSALLLVDGENARYVVMPLRL